MIIDKDLVAVEQACELIEAAHRAQAELARFDQEKIDRICEAMVRAALREARRLGAMAVEETGYGVAADKEIRTDSPPKACGTVTATCAPSA
jgi:acetaldehyde dehydrogenase (acetylating)